MLRLMIADADLSVPGDQPGDVARNRGGDADPAGLFLGREEFDGDVHRVVLESFALRFPAVGVGIVGGGEEGGVENVRELVGLESAVAGNDRSVLLRCGTNLRR